VTGSDAFSNRSDWKCKRSSAKVQPAAFYSDQAGALRVTRPGKTGNRVTPFGRAMYALNIDTFERPGVTGVHKTVAT
jgi:hypothetical protein